MQDLLKSLSFISAILFFLAAPTLQAVEETPPQFVYRADFRDPQIIFDKGFKSFGNNEKLLEHVEGVSCSGTQSQNSTFVATSSSEGFSKRFGADLLWSANNKSPFIYVYKIRATKNFYNVFSSLMKGYRDTKKDKYKETAEFFKHEKEWVALKEIPSNLIRSAAVYQRGKVRITLKEIRVDISSRYRNEQTQGNTKLFPVLGTGLIGRVFLLATRVAVSSCFKSCPSQASDAAEKSEREDSSKSVCQIKLRVFETTITADKATVWDPISKGPRERLVPWKEEVKVEGHHSTEKPADCSVKTGSANDIFPLLEVDCPTNRFYEKFRVLLKGGNGEKTLFHTKDKEGATGRMWSKSAKEIKLVDEKSLEEAGHRVTDVFSGGDKWWSKVQVYPVFPAYKPSS